MRFGLKVVHEKNRENSCFLYKHSSSPTLTTCCHEDEGNEFLETSESSFSSVRS